MNAILLRSCYHWFFFSSETEIQNDIISQSSNVIFNVIFTWRKIFVFFFYNTYQLVSKARMSENQREWVRGSSLKWNPVLPHFQTISNEAVLFVYKYNCYCHCHCNHSIKMFCFLFFISEFPWTMYRWFWATIANRRSFDAFAKHETRPSIKIAIGFTEKAWRSLSVCIMQ